MNVKRYDINYTRLVKQRIPVQISLPKLTALALSFAVPFVYTHTMLTNFRNLILYKLTITPQVVYLEKLLNDRYDTIERRIYIADGKEYTPTFLFKKEELKRVFLFRKSESGFLQRYLYTKNETGQFTYDFIIHIPVMVAFDMNELTALVNIYKLASKTFKIQIH
jgi:hypothetical protein